MDVRGMVAAALLPLVLAGCPRTPDVACAPGEARACTCEDGVAGAQFCTASRFVFGECLCDPTPGEADAGAELRDASAVPRDAGRAEVDAGPRDSGAPVRIDGGAAPRVDAGSGWACGVVPQSGCATGQACRLSEIGRMPGDGPPACFPAGTGAEGVVCTGADSCRAGMFCSTVCRRYCDPRGEPCPAAPGWPGGPPQRCVTSGGVLGPNPLGLGYCQG